MTGTSWPEWRQLLLAAEDMVRQEWHGDTTVETTSVDGEAPTGNEGLATTALDRIVLMGAVALDNGMEKEVLAVINSLVELYGEAEGPRNGRRRTPVGSDVQARRSLEVASSVYTLGALAVYDKQFSIVPQLIVQKADGQAHRSPWLRETVTNLARTAQLEGSSLIPFMAEQIFQRERLFARFRSRKDDVVDALCRFDFLQCLLAIGLNGNLHDCYPNFGAYYNDRTEPVIEELIARGPARAVLGDMTDAALADAIRKLDNLAGELFFSVNGWSRHSWHRGVIRDFLDAHPAP